VLTLQRPRAVLVLFAVVLIPLGVLLADPGRLAAWQADHRTDPESWSEIEQTAAGLEQGWDEYEARSQINRDLVAGLIAGRFTLAQACDLYWGNNRHMQGFRDLLGRSWDGDVETGARLNLLRLVRMSLMNDPTQTEVTDRLVAEYERTYGSFPLGSAVGLDQW